MALKETIQLTVDVQAKMTDLQARIKEAQESLKNLTAPADLKNGFEDIQRRIRNILNLTKNNRIDLIDGKEVHKELTTLESDFKKILGRYGNDLGKNTGLKNVTKEIQAINSVYSSYLKKIKEANDDISKQEKLIEKAKSKISRADYGVQSATNDRTAAEREKQEAQARVDAANAAAEKRLSELRTKHEGKSDKQIESYFNRTREAKELAAANEQLKVSEENVARAVKNEEDAQKQKSRTLRDANATINEAEQKINNLRESLQNVKTDAFEKIKQELSDMQAKGDVNFSFDPNTLTSVEDLDEKLRNLDKQNVEAVSLALEKVGGAAREGANGTNEMKNGLDEDRKATENLNKEFDQFQNRTAYFFGMNNAIRLFQRSVRSAFNSIKELDKAMTETAVVTDFSVGDMWNQLDEYTDRANELGVAIKDVYESMTIYYQQGLNTAEATALSNETMKMARIAGLDAADATDRMTNALRGFNMELNETNAQKVDDVYNKLAAISASNVDEISTAMTKVASLAHSANMEFETTAAFLSQIIETTRESAETAGTALKTVVARFSEVKELYTKGDLLGTDEDGEAIDVNKVSAALRTAGIDLNEYFTGMKGLDDIFIELAQKWDGLDDVQQRYIATMAAGSRQQSRFLAMMSDYGRTVELVSAAQGANGAANQMFEKTLESLETKLNKLSNAWKEFVMGIANSDIIKGAVDALTGFLNIINRITGILPGVGNSLSKIMVAFGGFKLARSMVRTLFPQVAKIWGEGGKGAAEAFAGGFGRFLNKGGFSGYIQNVFGQGSTWKRSPVLSMLGIEDAKKEANDLDLIIKRTGNNISVLSITAQQYANRMGIGFAAAGVAVMGFTKILEQNGVVSKETAEYLNILSGTLIGIGAAIPIIAKVGTVLAGMEGAAGAFGASIIANFGSILPVIIAAGVILGGVVAVFKAIKANSPEGKLEKVKNQASELAKSAEEAATKFDSLSNSIDQLKDKEDALKGLTKGTKEWASSVQDVNKQVLNLVEEYPELKVTQENGILSVDEGQLNKLQEEQQKDLYKKQIEAQLAGVGVAESEKEVIESAKIRRLREKDFGGQKVVDSKLIDVDQLVRFVHGELTDEEQANIEKIQEIFNSLNEEELEAFDKYLNAVEEADMRRENAINSAAALATVQKNWTDEQADIASDIYTEFFDEIEEKVTSEGIDTDLQPEEINNRLTGLASKMVEAVSKDEALERLFSGRENISDLDKIDTSKLDDGIREYTENRIQQAKDKWESLSPNSRELASNLGGLGVDSLKNIENYLEKSSSVSAEQLNNILSKVAEKDRAAVANAITSTDWSDLNQANMTADMLQDMDVALPDIKEFWSAATDAAGSYLKTTKDIDQAQSQFHEKFGSAQELQERLTSGKATSEDLAQLQKYGIDTTGYELTADGWKASEKQAEEAFQAATEAIAFQIDEAIQKNQERYNTASDSIYSTVDEKGNYQLSDLAKSDDTFDTWLKENGFETAEAFIEYLNGYLSSQTQLEKERDYQQAATYSDAGRAAAAGVTTEALNAIARKQYGDLGGVAEDFDKIVQNVQDTNEGLEKTEAILASLGSKQQQSGIDAILKDYDNWKDLIDETTGKLKKQTEEDYVNINTLKSNLKTALGIESDISDEFLEKNIDTLNTMATGTEEEAKAALNSLRKAMVEELLLTEGVVGAQTDNIMSTIQEILNKDYKIGENITDEPLVAALNKALTDAGIASDALRDIWESMGFTGEMVMEEKTAYVGGLSHVLEGEDPSITPVKITYPKQYKVTSKGGTSSTTFSGNEGRSGKTSKSSGGSKSSKEKNWENPYDELYNLQEKINESLRTREALERRYQKLLKQESSSLSDIRKSYYDQIKQLRTEADLQKQMESGRLRQIQNIGSMRYTDSDGNETTYAGMGVTKYASYDPSTGLIQIDWNAIDAIRDEKTGSAVESYISKLEELVGEYEQVRDELWNIEDTIEQLREEVIDSYLSFEDRVMDAVVNKYQDQIDELQKLSDTIDKSNQKVVDNLQESINLSKQIRDNTQTEQDIADKEQRLAYLQRDTSGANATEILKLQDEIEKARQNYEDTIINQAIDQLKKDNDLAAEQRADQIAIMQAQLDQYQKDGTLWREVYALINTAKGSDGSLSQNPELVKLLQDSEAFKSLSNIGQAKWRDELATAIKEAMVGEQEAEDKYKVDATNDRSINTSGTVQTKQQVGTPQSDASAHSVTASSGGQSGHTEEEKYGVALSIIAGKGNWGSGATKKNNLTQKGFDPTEIQNIINKLYAEGKVKSGAWVGAYYGIRDLSQYAMSKFKTGGLADFTGPAWLDGTKSKPELVLNAVDTENFIALKEILANVLKDKQTLNQTGGDNYFNIDISAEIDSDYDVDKLARRIKEKITEDATYRNVNVINWIR